MYSANDLFVIYKGAYLNRIHPDMDGLGQDINNSECFRAAEKATAWLDKWKEFYLLNNRDESKADNMLEQWKKNQ